MIQSKIMRLHEKNSVQYLTYNSLSKIGFINHGFSTRKGGVSTGEFTSMNLSFGRGDPEENVIQNYKLFCKAAGFDYNTLVASAQDHNTNVRRVTKQEAGIGIFRPKDMQSVDAIVTGEPGVTLVTYYADCTPLFFVDTAKKVIGLAHGGWRGTVGRIGEKVIQKMGEWFGSDPADILCAVGPAISRCCYEVDEPCANEFLKLNSLDTARFVTSTGGGKYMVDLLETNRQILVSAGVKPEHITLSDLCTKCNSDLLWSHRATNGKRGTLCAFLCMTEPKE